MIVSKLAEVAFIGFSRTTRESIPLSLALDLSDDFLRRSATPAIRSQSLPHKSVYPIYATHTLSWRWPGDRTWNLPISRRTLYRLRYPATIHDNGCHNHMIILKYYNLYNFSESIYYTFNCISSNYVYMMQGDKGSFAITMMLYVCFVLIISYNNVSSLSSFLSTGISKHGRSNSRWRRFKQRWIYWLSRVHCFSTERRSSRKIKNIFLIFIIFKIRNNVLNLIVNI